MNLLNKYKFELIGGTLGGVGGYLYYHFVGCASGSCSISASPINSTLYGCIMGALLFSMFRRETHTKNKNTENK